MQSVISHLWKIVSSNFQCTLTSNTYFKAVSKYISSKLKDSDNVYTNLFLCRRQKYQSFYHISSKFLGVAQGEGVKAEDYMGDESQSFDFESDILFERSLLITQSAFSVTDLLQIFRSLSQCLSERIYKHFSIVDCFMIVQFSQLLPCSEIIGANTSSTAAIAWRVIFIAWPSWMHGRPSFLVE